MIGILVIRRKLLILAGMEVMQIRKGSTPPHICYSLAFMIALISYFLYNIWNHDSYVHSFPILADMI